MKKCILLIFTLLALPSFAGAEVRYSLCTDVEEILNPENEFLIVSAKKSGSNIYAVTTSGESTILMGYNGTKPAETLTLGEGDVEAIGLGLFSFRANGDSYSLFETREKKYLGVTGTNYSSIELSENPDEMSAEYQFSVSVLDSNEINIIATAEKDRALSFNFTTKKFGNFKLENLSGTNYSYPVFYKEIPEVKEPVFSGFEKEYSLPVNESMDFPNILPEELVYTFSTENTNIIRIDNEAKTITALSTGTAVVKFSSEALAGKYTAGEGSFSITVTKALPSMRFRNPEVTGQRGVGVVWQTVSVISPENRDEWGKITYSSSDPAIVSVDTSTGEISADDIHAAGEAVITATMEKTADYTEGKAEYTVRILDPDSAANPATSSEVFDFTVIDPYGFESASGTIYESKVSEIIGPNDVITINFEGKYRSEATTPHYLRIINDGSFTVNVPEGYTISKIGLKGTTVKGKFSPESGENADGGDDSAGWGNLDAEWGPAPGSEVTSVKFTATASNFINKIYVMYKESGSDRKPAELSFPTFAESFYADTEAQIAAANNPNEREVTYSIADLDDEYYDIVPSSDNNSLRILVKTPGSYTLQAVSPEDEVYMGGYAIMRLNVFGDISVYVDGSSQALSTNEISTKTDVKIRIAIPEKAELYFKIERADISIASAGRTADHDSEADLNDYEPYREEISIPAHTNGFLRYYLSTSGFNSPVRKIALGDSVSVIETIQDLRSICYYDLEGRKINGTPSTGVHIRISNGKAEKILVR